MKQILLTLKRPEHLSQAEVKDFLAVCNHSPQWIGDESLWEIKSFQIWTEQKMSNGKLSSQSFITAMLENETWKEPEVKAMPLSQIFDALQNVDKYKIVEFGYRRPCGNILSFNMGYISTSIPFDDTYLISEGKDLSYRTRVKDLFSALCLSSFEEPDKDPEFVETQRNMTVAWLFNSNKTAGYPVTEVVIEDDKVIIIYNQDIVIE